MSPPHVPVARTSGRPSRRGRTVTRAAVVLGLSGAALLALAGSAAASPGTVSQLAGLHAGTSQTAVLAAAGEAAGPDAAIRSEAALAGYLSYGLMAMSVVWGIFLTTGWAKRIVRHQAVYNGHMTLALGTIAFGVIHALSYIFQKKEHFSFVKTFVPFVQGGEIEVALGIVGLELMIGAAVAVTLTHALNYRRFRKVHIGGTYVGAALSWVHVLTTSPEARSLGLVGITVAAAALVCIAMGVLRLLPPSRADRARLAIEPVPEVSR